MAEARVPVILLTREHLLSGSIATNGQRILDVLNDPNTDFLRVCDVHVCRRKSDTCVATLPEAVLRKTSVGLVIPTNKKHESPEKRLRHFVSKKQLAIFLVAFGYEVRGTVYLKGAADPVAALGQEVASFFPVANGDISSAGTFPYQREMPVVIVNQAVISLLQIGKPERSDSLASDAVEGLFSPASSATPGKDIVADLLATIAGLSNQVQSLEETTTSSPTIPSA